MRPYPGKLDDQQRIFNYRLSRARQTIENTFGILSARWRIFHITIRGKTENIEKYVLACLALHNYLRVTDNANYCPASFVDSYDAIGKIKEGEWRLLVAEIRGLRPINNVHGQRYREEVIDMRNSLREFVNSEDGRVSWQEHIVTRISY